MKVIDLLNKISENSNYHPTIEYGGITYKYNDCDYQNDKDNKYGILSGWCINLILNKEVKIIEEDENINIQDIEELNELSVYEDRDIKINELIRAVKHLEKTKEDK